MNEMLRFLEVDCPENEKFDTRLRTSESFVWITEPLVTEFGRTISQKPLRPDCGPMPKNQLVITEGCWLIPAPCPLTTASWSLYCSWYNFQ
jgi:hypothetical protein